MVRDVQVRLDEGREAGGRHGHHGAAREHTLDREVKGWPRHLRERDAAEIGHFHGDARRLTARRGRCLRHGPRSRN
jgi:hypothetical protein